jgi:hypothetical protein
MKFQLRVNQFYKLQTSEIFDALNVHWNWSYATLKKKTNDFHFSLGQ